MFKGSAAPGGVAPVAAPRHAVVTGEHSAAARDVTRAGAANRARITLRLLPRDAGYTPYLYLVYMAMTFVYPAVVRSVPIFIETAVAAAVFLVLYFRAYWLEGRALILMLAAIAAIGAILGPINPWAGTYFVYAAAFAPFVGSTPLGVAHHRSARLRQSLLEAALLHPDPTFWIFGDRVYGGRSGRRSSAAAEI